MEEMSELFYRDSYCREFTSKVTECFPCKEGFAVVLEDTAFYPEGGGQPGDRGTLNGIEVSDTRKIQGRIAHLVKEAIPEGSAVTGILDWQYRFQNMQSHTGEHLFSGLVHRRFGYENIGFHMGREMTTLDFDGPFGFAEALELEREANSKIWLDLPVQIAFPGAEELAGIPYRSKKELSGKVRIVTIPDCDICACCGTHLKTTGEIGILKVLSCSPHKGGTRVDILAGERAYDYIRTIWENNRETARLLRCNENLTGTETQRVLNESLNKDIRRSKLLHHYYGRMVEEAEKETTKLIFEEEKTVNELRLLGNKMLEAGKAENCVLLSADEDGFHYVILAAEEDMRPFCKELNKRLQGRGGGSKELVSGTFRAAEEEIREAVKEVFGC